MAKHRLDMTGVEEFTVVDEGRYLAEVVSMEEETASTGTEMEVGQFKIIKGEFTGTKVRENFPLTKKALFKVKQLLKALGLPHEGKNVVFDTDKILAKKVTIDVSVYEYDGKPRNRIDNFLPAAAYAAADGAKASKAKAKEADPDEEEDEEEEDKAPKYEDMKASALYSLCKERDIVVKSKLEAAVYIKKLKAWDAAQKDESYDEEDEWSEDDE